MCEVRQPSKPATAPLFAYGVQQGTSPTSFQVDEGSSSTNAAFFKAVFGDAAKGTRRFIVLKPVSSSISAATIVAGVVFEQSARSDTVSVVAKRGVYVFTCSSYDAGKAAGGESFKGLKAGGVGAAAGGATH